jgi:hypothetical protein
LSLKFTFVTGFDAAIRKKRLATLLDIKAFLDTFSISTYTENFPVLEAVGHELISFYSTTTNNPYKMESLTKQMLSSIEILKRRYHNGSYHALEKCVNQLKPELSKIITLELAKLEITNHPIITYEGRLVKLD